MKYRLIWKSAAIAVVGLGLVAGVLAQDQTTSQAPNSGSATTLVAEAMPPQGQAATTSSTSSGNAAGNAFTQNSEFYLGFGLVKTSSVYIPTVGQTYSEDTPGAWDLTYRYNASHWIAWEMRYNWSKGTTNIGATGNYVHVDAYEGEWSTDLAYRIIPDGGVQPYLLGGIGVLWFGPNSSLSNTPAADGQGRFAYVLGGGADFWIMKNLAFRAEYRLLYYRIPDFRITQTSTVADELGDNWAWQSVPTIGLVFKF